MSRILVGMSGGVDSTVAALRLKEQGYDIAGAYIKTWSDEYDVFGDCPSSEDIDYASAVCKQLGIDFQVVNLVETYHDRIVQYLIDGYRKGITPNPDIMCNREIKFGAFLDWAKQQGFESVATGHYCQKVTHSDGLDYIAEGLDGNKDQSYFLAMVTKEQLQYIRFPIGEITKPEVRELALKHNFPNAKRKDSQGICFLGKVKINDFLRNYITDNPGPIVNMDGKVLGQHKGLHHYTIGQRKGIGIPSNNDFKAYVVVAKDLETNTLKVSFDEPGIPGLYCDWLLIHSISSMASDFIHMNPPLCRVRYRDPKTPISKIDDLGNGSYNVYFKEPQRALAAGQILAFYDDNRLLGGGIMVPPAADAG